MKTRKLMELYGRRYTPFARLAGFVAILIFGILMAFGTCASDQTVRPETTVEQTG